VSAKNPSPLKLALDARVAEMPRCALCGRPGRGPLGCMHCEAQGWARSVQTGRAMRFRRIVSRERKKRLDGGPIGPSVGIGFVPKKKVAR
jgi:hypothetical protein